MSNQRFIALVDVDKGSQVTIVLNDLRNLDSCKAAYYCLGEHDILAEISISGERVLEEGLIKPFVDELDELSIRDEINHIHYIFLDTKTSFQESLNIENRILYSFISTYHGDTLKAVNDFKILKGVSYVSPSLGFCDVALRLNGKMSEIESLLVNEIINKRYVKSSTSSLVFKEIT